jgi:hypothetical protein
MSRSETKSEVQVSNIVKIIIAGTACAILAVPALAVEGALGVTLPGVWVQPQAGVVGPAPGFSFTLIPIGYMGSIGGAREVPIGGTLFTNVDANVSTNYLVLGYVYKTETPKVSLSSAFMAPVNWVGSNGSLQVNDLSRTASSANAGLGNVIAMPLTVGFHFSETNNLAVSAMVFAPTGQFRPGNLSNLGTGEWTVMPNVAHTYLWKKRGLEVDNFVGFDIYGQNATTKYTSGTMFHWDCMALQYLSERFALGAIGANLTQISNDRGPTANILHGFEGRAWSVGPILLYVAKVEKPTVVFQIRWVNEFEVTNLLKGNMLEAGLTLKLN